MNGSDWTHSALVHHLLLKADSSSTLALRFLPFSFASPPLRWRSSGVNGTYKSQASRSWSLSDTVSDIVIILILQVLSVFTFASVSRTTVVPID